MLERFFELSPKLAEWLNPVYRTLLFCFFLFGMVCSMDAELKEGVLQGISAAIPFMFCWLGLFFGMLELTIITMSSVPKDLKDCNKKRGVRLAILGWSVGLLGMALLLGNGHGCLKPAYEIVSLIGFMLFAMFGFAINTLGLRIYYSKEHS